MKTITNEEHYTLWKPIALGAGLVVAGLVLVFSYDNKIGGAVLIGLGIASAIMGVRGKTVKTTSTVPVNEKTPVPSQPVKKTTLVRREVVPPFTRNELQKILDILTQVDKIVRAI